MRSDRATHGREIYKRRLRAIDGKGRRRPKRPSAIGRILVPLDGSRASERVLRLLGAIEGRLGEIVFLHVVESVTLPVGSPPAGFLALPKKAEAYLASVRERFPRLRSRALVDTGNAADRILHTARRENVDMIAMTTHGRRGISRLVLGSVAEAVVRGSTLPILLVPQRTRSLRPLRRILVALDGTSRSDEILGPVTALAKTVRSQVILLHVVMPVVVVTEPVTGAATARVPEGLPDPGGWLSRKVRMLKRRGLEARSRVTYGEAAEEILSYARSLPADLIAMTVHAHSAVERFIAGSVATHVLRRADRPLLLQQAPAPRR